MASAESSQRPCLLNAARLRINRFGECAQLKRSDARWATRVMPIVLQQLMRHEDIETTLKYFVGQNAEAVADAVWATVESDRTSGSGTLSPETQKAETLKR